MFSRFFIDRPVFAGVVAIVIVLAGVLATFVLPIEQYPAIAPPTVRVTAVYPGANARTVTDTVTTPLEQSINGVENMIYMSSNSTDDGVSAITVTFESGTDLDIAAVQVQNRVSQAEATLPAEVRAQGLTVDKQSTSLLMVVSFFSPDDSFDEVAIADTVSNEINDSILRVKGVGGSTLFGGARYSMRIWLDPERMAARGLTTSDVLGALREQNVQVAAGAIGQEPTSDDAGLQLSISAMGRLSTVEQFQDVVVRVGEAGRLLRLGDIARIELGAQDYAQFSRLNGRPSPALGIYQLPGSNALEVAAGVRETLEALAPTFPPGMTYQITYDFTGFVSASIKEVVVTLAIAALLVFLTVFVFLQDWRATLIPTVAMPVSIIGTFAVLLAGGFSLNMLTLFGVVLAIGVVVDDAIVVVENTARNMEEKGMSSREAAIAAMQEISGAVVATTLVLLAVFVPTTLLTGITGSLYRQFGVTISVATVISSINALTLSPALCALLLRKAPERRFVGFRLFDRVLDTARGGYLWAVNKALRLSILVLLVYGGIVGGTVFMLGHVPTGFLPQEDQSVVFANIQLPDAAKLGRTDAVLAEVEAIAQGIPGVRDVIGIAGFSLISGAAQPNTATAIVILEDWDERTAPNEQLQPIMGQLAMGMGQIKEAQSFPFAPPPIQGIGLAGGFDMRLQDRGNLGPEALQDVADDMMMAAFQDPRLINTFHAYRARVPQLFVDIDRTRVKRFGLSLDEVFGTLQANLGSAYVNDVTLQGRTYQVRVQADHRFRQSPEDILQLQMRNADGGIVPMRSVAEVRDTVGPALISRYNLFSSVALSGSGAPGVSTGDARAVITAIAANTLPPGIAYEWSGQTYQELEAGNLAPIVFALAVVFAYLFLAAQYESWMTPLSILSTVPIGILGALAATYLRGLPNDIYTQVGLVLLVALVCKNAILIVEFAKQRREGGESVLEAAAGAAELRFRPILMTSFSFVLGTAPLLIATGAGASSRRAIGTAVFGGMVLATAVGVFFIPTIDAIVQRIAGRLRGGQGSGPAGDPDGAVARSGAGADADSDSTGDPEAGGPGAPQTA